MFNQKKYEKLLFKYMSNYSYKTLTTIFILQIMEKEKKKFLDGGDLNE